MQVYELLDVDSNGSIDYSEMSDGLSNIRRSVLSKEVSVPN